MTKLKQFDALKLFDFEESNFHLTVHGQNYYELVYIYKGSGIHEINNNSLAYNAGDLFVISPEDEHNFKIEKRTRVIAIKFTDDYFSNSNHWTQQNQTLNKPIAIMNNKILKEIKLEFNPEIRKILRNTIDNILLYNSVGSLSTSPLVFHQILSIFGIIIETMTKMLLFGINNFPAKELLISYIHQHIYEPKQIQIKQIAAHFNIAPTYFSTYFKRNFDMGYRDYLTAYKITLIDKRLASGLFTFRQIADEFGFNDESHFSHFYKNSKGVSPSAYSRSKK